MPAANSMSIKRETLNLRIKPAERDLIDRAAKARGKNRTDFVLEAARAAAEKEAARVTVETPVIRPKGFRNKNGRSAGLSGISRSSGSGSCT